MEDGHATGVVSSDVAERVMQDTTRNINQESPTEGDLSDSNNVWETKCNKRREAERKKEMSKEATRYRLLECLLATNNEMLDVNGLCSKYLIPIRAHDENGEVYDREELELRRDVEAALEEEREKAWSAEHQAAMQVADPYVRTLSRAEGISQNTKFIAFSNDDLVPLAKGWGPSLCGMFAGRFPGKSAVHGLTSRWRVPVKVAYHRKGWMVFSFRFAKDMDKVLSMGPQAIFGIPLILEPLSGDFDFNKKLKVNIPVWIRIPDLPLSLWSRSAIEKIASVAGTPVMVDEATILKHAIDGPRVQIIVNILDEIRKEVKIVMPDGREFEQVIAFENLPKYCRACSAFGHIGDGCPGPEERERERIRRARIQRPASRPPSARAPSRGPERGAGRSKSRGRSQAGNAPTNENLNVNGGKWMPAGKAKGWRAKQLMGEGPAATDQLETSNKFAGLETGAMDEAEPSSKTNQPKSNPNPKTSKGDKVTYPIIIQGEAYRSAINAVDKGKKAEQPVPKHADPANHPEGYIEDEDEEVDEVDVPPPPVVEVHQFQANDPAEFPPLPETVSNRKGRKKKTGEGLALANQGPERPQRDNCAQKPLKIGESLLGRRGRPLGSDDTTSVARERSRSVSREPEKPVTETSPSDDDDASDMKLPLDARVVSHRLLLSCNGRDPFR